MYRSGWRRVGECGPLAAGSAISALQSRSPQNGYVRIGSTTKTFVATALLQLVGEGRLSLDDTVDQWLPGVVRGHGNNGRRVTLRQLLQHASGLPDYIGDVVPDLSGAGYRKNRWTTYTSEQRVAFAMQHPPSFMPGSDWEGAEHPLRPHRDGDQGGHGPFLGARGSTGFCVRYGSHTLSYPATGRSCRVPMPVITSSSSRAAP